MIFDQVKLFCRLRSYAKMRRACTLNLLCNIVILVHSYFIGIRSDTLFPKHTRKLAFTPKWHGDLGIMGTGMERILVPAQMTPTVEALPPDAPFVTCAVDEDGLSQGCLVR